MRDFLVGAGICFEEKVSLKKLTTFGTGGVADIVCFPKSTAEIRDLLRFCKSKNVPYFCLGNGSNVIASDDGFHGLIIKIGPYMSQIFFENDRVVAQAGALASQLACFAKISGLTGVEFLSGIPGCIGGAVVMNAGCFGREISDATISVCAVDENGEREFGLVRCGFAYRKSVFQTNGCIVTHAVFGLRPAPPEEVGKNIAEIVQKKKLTQPLDFPSAGSVFRAEGGVSAGLLIDRAGLKGLRIGGAEISAKHANFIVNKGNATTADVLELMDAAGCAVKRKFGVVLKPEIKYIGDTDDIGRLSYSFTV